MFPKESVLQGWRSAVKKGSSSGNQLRGSDVAIENYVFFCFFSVDYWENDLLEINGIIFL